MASHDGYLGFLFASILLLCGGKVWLDCPGVCFVARKVDGRGGGGGRDGLCVGYSGKSAIMAG